MNRITRLAIAASAVYCTIGHTQEAETEIETIDASALAPVAEEACLLVREARDFDVLDDEFVFVEGRRDRNYLLTVFTGCFGLRNAIGIVISSSTSRVCSNSGAEIRYRGLGRQESCPIRKVEAVDSRAAAERVAELRSE